jgi:hypothetical protein
MNIDLLNYMKMQRLFCIVLLCLLLFGCVSQKKIQTSVQACSVDLPYTTPQHWLRTEENRNAIKVEISYDSSLQATTQVEKERYWCVPLLFVNLWEAKYNIHCGEDVFSDSVEDHIFATFASTLSFDSHYPFSKEDETRFRLEVVIEELCSHGHYYCFGSCVFAIYAYSYTEKEFIGVYESYAKARYSIFDGDFLVYEGQCSTAEFTPELYSLIEEKVKHTAPDFVESAGISIDNCIDALSNDIVCQSNMVLDIYNDVKLRIKSTL